MDSRPPALCMTHAIGESERPANRVWLPGVVWGVSHEWLRPVRHPREGGDPVECNRDVQVIPDNAGPRNEPQGNACANAL